MWEKWIRIKPSKTDKSKVRKQAVVAELPLLPELGDVLSFAPSGKADGQLRVWEFQKRTFRWVRVSS
jgi:hypothetical protein